MKMAVDKSPRIIDGPASERVGGEHAACVPDRKLILYFSRSLKRTSTFRFIIALSVLAFTATAIAVVGRMPGSGSARPIRPAHQVSGLSTQALRAGSLQAGVLGAGAHRAGAGRAAGARVTTRSTQATAALPSHRLGWKREIAWQMMYSFNWQPTYQFRYVNWLWQRESTWRIHAYNPFSGAYGIPQALPGSKMSTAGPNWRNSARTQIRWGLGYIEARYGTPSGAWAHERAYGWY